MGCTPTAIRRIRAADRAALAGFFAGLSVRTRTLRFFAPVRPGQAMLRRLAGAESGIEAVVATCGGAIIGHAMAVDRPGPGGSLLADIGVVVGDAWQGHGVGSALTRALAASAADRGVTSLVMEVLPENRQVLAMIAAHWDSPRRTRSADSIAIHVPLPAAASAPRRVTAPPQPERHPGSPGSPQRDHDRSGARAPAPA